jgi:hypothetical protein
MKFVLEIDLKNAAFHGQYTHEFNGHEVARILRRAACEVSGSDPNIPAVMRENDGVSLRDINGNLCGQWKVVE